MELSPKQQTVEQIKKAKSILIIGHKNPSGDFLGAALAFKKALAEIGKKVEVAITDPIPEIFHFLPLTDQIKTNFTQNTGKILRINTQKVPVKSVKFQKDDQTLDFILETERNLKFEFIEIINGEPKPDLILVLNTPDVEKIDTIYDKNTELFFEVPVINIDHHAGNEYFGTVNLVDLTATSTAEILVALLEALGIKINDADSATLLLAGIIAETASFRSQNTTPKSLTVAAQLLAAGGRQQEIVNNLYRKRPMALMKIWGEMIADLKLDANHQFGWTKVKLLNDAAVSVDDVMDSADELLTNNPQTETILILCQKGNGPVVGKIKARKGHDVLPLAKLFEGDGVPTNASFELKNLKLGDAELMVLKTLADYWGEAEGAKGKDIWNIVEEKKANDAEAQITATPKVKTQAKDTKSTPVQPAEVTIKQSDDTPSSLGAENKNSEDIIDSALNSIEKEESKATSRPTGGNFSSIGEVLYKKTTQLDIPIKSGTRNQRPDHKVKSYGKKNTHRSTNPGPEIDVFDESENS